MIKTGILSKVRQGKGYIIRLPKAIANILDVKENEEVEFCINNTGKQIILTKFEE